MQGGVIWLDLKAWLEAATSLDRDALHIYAAIVVQGACALVFRRSLASPLLLLPLLGLELANEWADLRFEVWPNRQDQWIASLHDVLNTLAVPLLVMLIARRERRLADKEAPECHAR